MDKQRNKVMGFGNELFTAWTLCGIIFVTLASTVGGYQDEGFKRHNELRRKHNSQPLTLSPILNERAELCANWYLDNNKMNHLCPNKTKVPEFGYVSGENLCGFLGTWYPPWQSLIKATETFYQEVRHYDFEEGCKKGKVCDHFTQTVWNSSTHVGLGFAKKGGHQVVVVLYWPHGNSVGQYRKNVFPPREDDDTPAIQPRSYYENLRTDSR